STSSPSRRETLTRICEIYKETLLTECSAAIEQMKEHSMVSVELVNIENMIMENKRIENIPIDVLHYGHRTSYGGRTNRAKFFECERPFVRVQQDLLEKGYYLLDVSDPKRGPRCKIFLFCTKPYHYGQI